MTIRNCRILLDLRVGKGQVFFSLEWINLIQKNQQNLYFTNQLHYIIWFWDCNVPATHLQVCPTCNSRATFISGLLRRWPNRSVNENVMSQCQKVEEGHEGGLKGRNREKYCNYNLISKLRETYIAFKYINGKKKRFDTPAQIFWHFIWVSLWRNMFSN